MGIINATPDSFSDGGRYVDANHAADVALQMIADGATVIDVGGESTRPGAAAVGAQEEARRVIPVIAAIRARSDVAISIDTSKASVAEAAIGAGADIINDVSGFGFDPRMSEVCAGLNAGCVLMHTPGRPDVMDALGSGDDVVATVCADLRRSTERALAAGVARSRIAVDPGFGFGKKLGENFELLRCLDRVAAPGFPVLIGVSRKRMIRGVAGDAPAAISHANTAVHMAGLERGAEILRVHEVGPAIACVRSFVALRSS